MRSPSEMAESVKLNCTESGEEAAETAKALLTMKDNTRITSEATSPSKYPTRTRKRNRFIFNDEEETEMSSIGSPVGHGNTSYTGREHTSPRKSPKAHSRQPDPGVKCMDKKVAQKVGLRLRTLLKLPKAHKWVSYEWFYANIDQPLFEGENDFQVCLRESFPQLKTRMLRRAEWSKIRRLMGKPRRCSQSFFAEERASLNSKRNKIRQLQQQKVVDITQYRDLPDNIPLSLVIGTRVTALLHQPQDGLFCGTIDAVDTSSGAYRITFDRNGIGTHAVPDFEVLSNDTPEFLPLSSFQTKVRPRLPLFTSPRFLELLGNQVAQALGDNDPLISGASPIKSNLTSGINADEGTLGGFPIKFLALLVRLSKILAVKKKKIYELKSMNTEAEKMRSLQEVFGHEFQKQYAGTILELEKLNIDLNDYLKAVHQYSTEIAPEQGLSLLAQPDIVKQKFLVEAKETVERSLACHNVKCERAIEVVSHLLSLMLHLRGFAETEVSSYELKSLYDAVEETRKTIDPLNVSTFENQVEIHVNHIQSNLSHLGNLGAFAESVMESPL